ncbi:unnamed protein product [Polarella glacialis]|uniref:Post-GPI attachment to proteins factor 3 n=1 Tax=Polarella glacialis TaxID=89957 RepID=A0A813J573_POLGL|nr:unnamed protein product [Polarella glacialis]
MLHPAGQATDELAMICASLAFLYLVLEVGHKEVRRKWLPFVEAAYAAAFTVAYFSSPVFFPFFIATYAMTVVLIIYQAYRVYEQYRLEDSDAAWWQRRLFWIAAIGYPAGFLLLWVPENAVCPYYPWLFQVLNLHAVFHIVTTMSPYSYIVFMTYHRMVVLKREAEHRIGIGLPYVHACPSKSAP